MTHDGSPVSQNTSVLPGLASRPDGHLESGLGRVNSDKDLRLAHQLSFR